MFVKKFLSFALGVLIASAWWQAAMFHYGDGVHWLITGVVTIFTIFVILRNCVKHINDK